MSHRTLRVSELIRRELATLLEKNCSFPGMLLTVHGVDTAADLKNATVHVGILGGKEEDYTSVMERLNKQRGLIQRDLYKRVKLKSSPQLYFKHDRTAERGVHMINVIEELPAPAVETDKPLGNFVGDDGLDHRWEPKEDQDESER
jgi:ribosome-binding factor A